MRLNHPPMLALAAVAALAACSGNGLDDTRFQTGTTTIAADASYSKLFAVNVHEGSVSIATPGGSVEQVEVGVEPTRVARVGDRMVVTLRGERALAELDGTTGELIRKVETGAEPFGVVATEDGERVYVSVAMEGIIEERDGGDLSVLRTFDVPGEPRWMALHPSGNTLVVNYAKGDTFSTLSLEDGQRTDIALPTHTTSVFVNGVEGQFTLAGRLTGDPAFSSDGRTLALAGLFVDNTSGESGTGGLPSFPYYAAAQSPTFGRFNSGLVLYRTRSDGTVDPEPMVTQFVADFADSQSGVVLRSYLSSVAPSPDHRGWLVTMEASDGVMLVDGTLTAVQPDPSGLAFPSMAVINTARGPRGIATLSDQNGQESVFVHSFLDHSIADVNYPAAASQVAREVNDQNNSRFGFGVGSSISADPGVDLIDSDQIALTPEELDGASLFYSAADATMGAAGVSCSTCHFDGRTDGLTWKLMNGDRQTPSLAGLVSETAPVTWTEAVPGVAEEAMFTAEFRMGSSLSEHRAHDIEAFIDSVGMPDLPEVKDTAAVERGREIFSREDVGCSECHNGAAYTDNGSHDMYGMVGVNTPTLVGISATAPYLHDGSASTLRDVLISASTGGMGDTSMLSEDELDDLETFLRSL